MIYLFSLLHGLKNSSKKQAVKWKERRGVGEKDKDEGKRVTPYKKIRLWVKDPLPSQIHKNDMEDHFALITSHKPQDAMIVKLPTIIPFQKSFLLLR